MTDNPSLQASNSPIDTILPLLKSVKSTGENQWQAQCPAHVDKNPSLSIGVGDDRRVLFDCKAGCSPQDVCSAVGITLRDLFPRDGQKRKTKNTSKTKSSPRVYPTACEAIAALERQLGTRSAHWVYHRTKGVPEGVVSRWDTPQGKTFRQTSRNAKGWCNVAMTVPRPLYMLSELNERSGERVYICEGEKTCDALRSFGLLATTSSQGAKGTALTDWQPLTGRNVVILPDNDTTGDEFSNKVTSILASLNPLPKVREVELPDLPPKGDAVEFIAARRAACLNDDAIQTEIEALVNATEVVKFDQPRPKIERYQPFPVEVLPKPIRNFVVKGAKAIGCDASYLALAMLSALASAIGNTRRIQLKHGWSEPVIVWTAIVGESGTLKTPAFRSVIDPIRDLQVRKLKEHAEEYKLYEEDHLHYENKLLKWKRANGTDEPPEKPTPPQSVRYIVNDTTIEALIPILLHNPRGVLLVRDELAGWIGSFDQYRSSGADVSHWLSMHGGETIIVDRKHGAPPTMYVPSATVSIAGGIQPKVLNRVMGRENRENGLLARFLLAQPPQRCKKWSEAQLPASFVASVVGIYEYLHSLKFEADEEGNPRAKIIGLTPAAKTAWINFYNQHALEQAELTGHLAAAWSKLEGYAARLALIIHYVRVAAGDPTLKNPDAVDESSITAGVVLTKWFGFEAKRIYSMFDETDEQSEKRKLVDLIDRTNGIISTRELQQSSRRYKTAESAEKALNRLVKDGCGKWENLEPSPKGGRSKRVFKLFTEPTVYGTPEKQPEYIGCVDVDNVDTAENDSEQDQWGEL